MELDNLIIRNATINDIDKIAEIKVDGWKNTYNNIIDSSILDNLSIEKEKESYLNKYSLNDVFIVENSEDILGFCRVYDYEESPYDDKNIDCEIREIYVRTDLKRMGIGSKLFTYILSYFKNKGKKKLYLGVFEENYNSRKFYEKMGGTLYKKDSPTINDKDYPTVSYLYDLKK